jgi:hypothetical protein
MKAWADVISVQNGWSFGSIKQVCTRSQTQAGDLDIIGHGPGKRQADIPGAAGTLPKACKELPDGPTVIAGRLPAGSLAWKVRATGLISLVRA